jgi:NADH:ubiquinone oxidoreductase subunit E
MSKSHGSTASCACTGRPLTEEEMASQCDAIVREYKDRPGGLIPALQTAQGLFGYLPTSVVKAIADGFGKPYSEVAGVVSFYSFFSTRPRGKYLIRVCLGTACYVRGGKDVLEALKKKLGVEVGETTADRNFTLDVGRCFGACGMAPVIMVNDTVHQRVKPTRIGELLARLLAGDESKSEKGYS